MSFRKAYPGIEIPEMYTIRNVFPNTDRAIHIM